MQVFTLGLLFLAAGLFLAPGSALSRQFDILRKIATSNGSKYTSADREPRPIVHASQQNSSQYQFSAVIADFAITAGASKNRGRPEAK